MVGHDRRDVQVVDVSTDPRAPWRRLGGGALLAAGVAAVLLWRRGARADLNAVR